MSNKFEKGDEVIIDLSNVPCSALDIGFFNGKSGIVRRLYTTNKYDERCYEINLDGDLVLLSEKVLKLKTKPTEEQSLRELLIKNKEVLLGNRKVIDESLELIETMLNRQ